ncbi:MAG TPA: hypothetical protein VF652_10570 [Allosphingosinicella sp.]|jgi:hypothetical protein
MSIKSLNEELSAAPALNIEVLTGEELSAVAGGVYSESDSLDAGCTCGTQSVCHIDGTTDSN